MRRTASAVLGLAAVLLLAACPGDDPDPPAPPPATPAPATPPAAVELPEGVTPAMVTDGQQLFAGAGNCFTCHGADGTGTPLEPNLRDDTWLNTDGSFAQIEQVIRDGVENPVQYPAPMPAMGGARLTDERVRALAAYVYSISHGG